MRLWIRALISLIFCLLIEGCAITTPADAIQPMADDSIHLQAGQGLAAVIIDSSQPLTQILLTPLQKGLKTLVIPSSPTGKHLYLFVTDAGTYCIHHFNTARSSFDAKVDNQCFEVETGKISYGGVFEPFIGFTPTFSSIGAMTQRNDWDGFWKLLKSTYPTLAGSAFATPETIANERPPAPISSGICKFMSVQDATDLLGAQTDSGTELDAIAPACSYSHTDKQVVRVALLTHGDLDEKALNMYTPTSSYGWSKWVSVPGLADEARFVSRDAVLQLYVLKTHRFILILTVEGSQRADMEDAMARAAKTVLGRLSQDAAEAAVK